MHKEQPKQLDFFNSSEEEEAAYEPTPAEERWRLEKTYGAEAGKASLSKGEGVGRAKRKKEKIQKIIEETKKAVGINKEGRQENIGI